MEDPFIRIQSGPLSCTVSFPTLRSSSKYFDALWFFHYAASESANSFLQMKGSTILYIDEPLSEALFCLFADLPFQEENLHQQSRSLDLDQLFECVLVSSKYVFECLERQYSHQLVARLRQCAANYQASEIIPPSSTGTSPVETSTLAEKYLSLLDIRQLAQAYQLYYLQDRVCELIEEKRALARQRLFKLFFGG